MLRVCVIGMGPIGNQHARLYREDALAELVGVCDIDADRAEAAAAAHGVPAFGDARRMLDELKPDVVSIATGGEEYGSDHCQPTLQAIAAGCHVLGEKPISNDIAEAERMVAAARDQGVCYGVNLNHRFTPAARLAKQWQSEGRLGDLLFVNMSMWIKNPRESSPWFQIKALHPHTVDVMRHFAGDVRAVQCFVTKAPGRAIWSTATFNMQFASGTVGTLTGSYDIERGHPMERCEVAGTKGRFVIEDMWRQATLYPAGDMVKLVHTDPCFGGFESKGGFENTFRTRIHVFLQQITDGCKPEDIDASGADGLAAQKVLAAAIESVERRTVVDITP
jgi:predicted dehydrogenase